MASLEADVVFQGDPANGFALVRGLAKFGDRDRHSRATSITGWLNGHDGPLLGEERSASVYARAAVS